MRGAEGRQDRSEGERKQMRKRDIILIKNIKNQIKTSSGVRLP